MRLFFQNIPRSLRCCLRCGSLFVHQIGLCRTCYGQLIPFCSPPGYEITLEEEISIRPLLIWGTDESFLISSLMSAWKGRGGCHDFAELASKMVNNFWSCPLTTEKACLIPSPPRRGREFNHAHGLALELGRLLSLPVLDCLVLHDEGIQKIKGRTLRQQRRISLREEFTDQIEEYERYLFVDDVVTTGSTAKAAKKALSPGREFMVLSLCYRPLLRGVDDDAIPERYDL